MLRMRVFARFLVAVLVANFEFVDSRKNALPGSFSRKRFVCQNPDQARTKHTAWIYLRLALPYNKSGYVIHFLLVSKPSNKLKVCTAQITERRWSVIFLKKF